jgi:transposase
VDTIGLLLTVLVTAASVQDRDAAKPLLWNLRKAFPQVKLAWADGGYAGKLVIWAWTRLRPKLTLQIVRRPDDLHTFQVLPRRQLSRMLSEFQAGSNVGLDLLPLTV